MSNRAWVTLATNDSYGLGALVLAHSLRRSGSAYPAVVLITPSVTDAMRDRLSAVFAEVITVNVLDSRDAAHLALLQRPELGITFTKIHCWSLTQYNKCVFLDADTLIVQNSDDLFDREELSAAPDVGWPDCFNSGVFVFAPSADTYSRLIAFAQERGSFDGGDQGLLNAFFSDWAHGDINKHLPFLYNVTSAAFYSYLPALKHFGQNLKIIHFIGNAKPWLQRFNWASGTVDAPEHVREHLQLWWDLFVGQVHTRLDTTMDPLVVEVEEASPVLLKEDLQQYYAPKVDAKSEFHWHHPDTQKKESQGQTQQLDMSQFYDPWKNYRGNIQPNQNYQLNPHSETKVAEDQKETKTDVGQQILPQQHFVQTQHVQVSHQQNAWQQQHYDRQQHSQHHQDQVHQPQHQIHQVYQSHSSHTQPHSQSHDQHSVHYPQSYQMLPNEQHESKTYQDASQKNVEQSHDNAINSQQEYKDQYVQHVQTNFTHDPFQDHTAHSQHSLHHSTQQEPLPINVNHKQTGNDHSEPHVASADHNAYRSDGFIRLDPNTTQQSGDEQVYRVHMDLRRQSPQKIIHNHNSTGSVVNGLASESDSDDQDDFIPRHPYDGFYLRHRSTIDSHGRKICTHEVPPPPPSPPPSSPLPDDASPLAYNSNEDSQEFSASVGGDTSGVAGNLARVQPGAGHQSEALDELTRRQGWEAGNIDYMGADSFDNIWAKISQTLNQSPPKQPSPPRKEPTPPKGPSPPKEAAPVETHAQVEAAAPAEFTAPVSAPTSVQSAAPVEEPAPAKASAPAEPSAPGEATVPTEAPAPAEAPAPVEAPAPAEAPAPTEAPAPVEAPAPAEAPAPTEAPAPVEAPAPAEAPAPVASPATPEVSAPAEAPVSAEVSTPSATTEVPAPSEAPALAAAPGEVQTPIEAPAPVEVATPAELPVAAEAVAAVEAPAQTTTAAPAESVLVATAKSEAAPTESEVACPEAPKEEAKTESTVPPTPPVTPKSTPEASTPVTETAPKVETSEAQSAPTAVESPKVTEPAPAPAPVVAAPQPSKPDASATPDKAKDTSAVTTASTDSPPLVHTPSKPEAPAVPPSKSEERRKPAGKLQLVPPAAADPLPTPDSEQEDAAALAQSIIASELSTTLASPSPSAEPASPPPPKQEHQLSAEGPEAPTPPVSLAQIGVKPKGKASTAAQIESSVSEKEPSSPTTPTTPTTPTDAPKKKMVKKVAKKEAGSSGDTPTPVPPPRKKEKKPKEK